MNLESLRCFCAVVETSGFRQAAERVHRSQPAVSQQIKNLEQETGRTLYDRRSRTTTPAGQMLYERARRILRDAEDLGREIADFDETSATPLRIGTSDTTALYFLPPVVQAFARHHPNASLTLLNRPSSTIADLVETGEVDLGIVTLPIGRDTLEEELLFEERLVLVTPMKHALARKKRLALAALRDEPFLTLDETTRTGALLRDYFTQHAFTPRVACVSGSFEVIKRYVAKGVGLAFLPAMAVTDTDEDLATVPMPDLPKMRIGAISRRGGYESDLQRCFRDLVRKR